MNVGTRIVTVGAGSIAAATFITMAVGIWQTSAASHKAKTQVRTIVKSDLQHIVEGVRNTVRCQDGTLRQTVQHNLDVEKHIVKEHGRPILSGSRSWKAVNQLTKQSTQVNLPVMSIGGMPLTGNTDPSVTSPVVDEVQKLVGGVATVFQRMNDEGDLLRVATNVIGKNGDRAVGTYIPAVNPDGTPNPVASKIKAGIPFQGVAFVVDSWYVTAYDPIKDFSGKVIGALFTGVKQESNSVLREALKATKVGKTGYMWVIGCKKDAKGKYIISDDSNLDGQSALAETDASGKKYIEELADKGSLLGQDDVMFYNYSLKASETSDPSPKLCAATYYEPWDWLIVASCDEKEMYAAAEQIGGSMRNMIIILVLAGLAGAVVAYFLLRRLAEDISSRLKRLTSAAHAMAIGDILEAESTVNR